MSSDATPRAGGQSKDVGFYNKKLEAFDPSTREVLERYSKIPSDEVEKHVYEIRDRGWDVFSYPCIGQFRFLDLSLGHAPQYAEVLKRVKSGARLLDLGCCFGQDVRRLVVDGAPDAGANLYGADLQSEFFDLGYDLFRDRETLRAHFLKADIFEAQSALNELKGSVDIIHAAAFLHLFDWDQQLAVLRAVVKLLKPVKGSLMLGRQVGNVEGKETMGGMTNRRLFRHNEESWRKLWSQISQETGTNWDVTFMWDGAWSGASEQQWMELDARPMRYAVWRV